MNLPVNLPLCQTEMLKEVISDTEKEIEADSDSSNSLLPSSLPKQQRTITAWSLSVSLGSNHKIQTWSQMHNISWLVNLISFCIEESSSSDNSLPQELLEDVLQLVSNRAELESTLMYSTIAHKVAALNSRQTLTILKLLQCFYTLASHV
jgi:hypothetical protein